MARTTPTLVKGLLLRDYDSKRNPSLQPFIDSASMIIDRVKVLAVKQRINYTDAQLELIERWLSAHGYVMTDQNYAQTKILTSSALYQGRTGMRLEGSKYGQYAMSLDYSGSLSQINSSAVIEFTWLGKREQEQISYDDRNDTSTSDYGHGP